MLPSSHIILGIIFSTVLLLSGIPLWQALIIFSAAVLIDVDHYFLYSYLRKDINPKNALLFYINEGKKYQNKKYQYSFLCIFHVFEVLLLLTILSFFSRIALLILIGIIFHICLDLFDILIFKKPYLKSPSIFFRKKVKI